MLHKGAFYFSLILFRWLLEGVYASFVATEFNYAGFHIDLEFEQYMLSWVVYLASFVFLRDRLRIVSDYVFLTAVLVVMAPLSILYGYDAERPAEPLLAQFAAIVVTYGCTRFPLLSFRWMATFKGGEQLAIAISALVVLFTAGWYIASGVTLNLDMDLVYEYREDNARLAAVGILAYTNSWAYQAFNVFLFATALRYRRYMLAGVCVVFQVYFYAASAHKAVLFLPVLVFCIWFYFRKSDSLLVLPILFGGIVLAGLGTYLLWEDLMVSSLFARRVLFVPANLTYVYFDFFSFSPRVYWSNSVLSVLGGYPYDLPVANVVGRYLGDPGLAANNGFVASGYGHAGYYGVFFYSALLGLILRLLNDITERHLPVWFGIALVIVPLQDSLLSSDLFTAMLTHGLIVATTLIFLARRKSVELEAGTRPAVSFKHQ